MNKGTTVAKIKQERMSASVVKTRSESSKRRTSYDTDNMENDDFDRFLSDDYSVHKNDEAMLADFTALLNDNDDQTMATVDRNLKQNAKELSKTDSQETSQNKRKSRNSIEDENELSTEELSQRIGSIMSDHDYLSRENTMTIIRNDEECFFQQGRTQHKSNKTENDSMEVMYFESSQRIDPFDEPKNDDGDEQVATGKESENASSNPNTNSTQANKLNSFFNKFANDKTSTEDLKNLLFDIVQKTRLLREMIDKKDGESSVNRCQRLSSQQSVESNPTFSSGHSEPMEYHESENYWNGSDFGSGKCPICRFIIVAWILV